MENYHKNEILFDDFLIVDEYKCIECGGNIEYEDYRPFGAWYYCSCCDERDIDIDEIAIKK